MKGKTIIYCGIFIFLMSLILTFYNLSHSGILQMFFPNEISAGIGNLGGTIFSLILFILSNYRINNRMFPDFIRNCKNIKEKSAALIRLFFQIRSIS